MLYLTLLILLLHNHSNNIKKDFRCSVRIYIVLNSVIYMRPKGKRIFRETREFVERETGRGTATSTLTTNPNTALSAMRKNSARSDVLPIGPRKLLNYHGFSIFRKSKSSLTYIGKGNSGVMAHENAHNAFRHYKKKNKQRVVSLATEMFACSFQLEWLLERDKSKYDRLMEKKYSTFRLKKAFFLTSFDGIRSRPGMVLAKRIQEKLTSKQRKQFRQELLEKDLKNQEQVLKFVNKRFAT